MKKTFTRPVLFLSAALVLICIGWGIRTVNDRVKDSKQATQDSIVTLNRLLYQERMANQNINLLLDSIARKGDSTLFTSSKNKAYFIKLVLAK